MRLILEPKPPFDFHLTATHMYVLPPAKYSSGTFSRVLRLRSGKLARILISSAGTVEKPRLLVLAESPSELDKSDEEEIRETISFMFSLMDDLNEFYSLIEKDPILKYAKSDMYGLKVQTAPTLFEGLTISFCLQWISFERAVKNMDAMIKKFGERLNEDYAFPSTRALAEASLEELKNCMLGFRAERIKWLSTQAAETKINLEELVSLPDAQLREELMKIKWVGPWTAEGVLLWRLKRYGAFPIDLWSARIISTFYPEAKGRSLTEIRTFAEKKWGNNKGLAFYYLMCDRENLAKRLGICLEEKCK